MRHFDDSVNGARKKVKGFYGNNKLFISRIIVINRVFKALIRKGQRQGF